MIMQYTDDQIQKMLELKESIIDKMAKHQEELDFLEKNLEILDVILKGSSFAKASTLPRKVEAEQKAIKEASVFNEEGRIAKDHKATSSDEKIKELNK